MHKEKEKEEQRHEIFWHAALLQFTAKNIKGYIQKQICC